MDIYDDDPIRKDAVQHENLVVIQAGTLPCAAMRLAGKWAIRRTDGPSDQYTLSWRGAQLLQLSLVALLADAC